MNSSVPPQLDQVVSILETAIAKAGTSNAEFGQLDILVEDVEEHLRNVARPIRNRDKTGSRGVEPPTYAFGTQPAENAAMALSHTSALKNAVDEKDWRKALDSAQRIKATMDK